MKIEDCIHLGGIILGILDSDVAVEREEKVDISSMFQFKYKAGNLKPKRKIENPKPRAKYMCWNQSKIEHKEEGNQESNDTAYNVDVIREEIDKLIVHCWGMDMDASATPTQQVKKWE